MKYKNKFLNLRKQIEEFNVINEEWEKSKIFSIPLTKINIWLCKTKPDI
jgi:hypothetical protein